MLSEDQEDEMRVLLQRVSSAKVTVDGEITGQIGRGLLLFVGIGQGDDKKKLSPMASKLCCMRIFENEKGRFDVSLLDAKGDVLLVPQFTLFADTSKGRRPEFFGAMEPRGASELFDLFCEEFKKLGVETVATGRFGTHMRVELVNDGPVTLMVEI